MLSRRDILFAGIAALGPVLPACSRPRRATYEGVEALSIFPNGATDASPVVVAVHGQGGRPEDWIDRWRSFPARAEVAFPRGFAAYGQGSSWFMYRDGMTDEEFGAEVGAAEERLWRGVARLARGRRLVVTGFSQGGFFAYAMAARHAGEIAEAVPISASCPGPLLPKNGARAARVVAYHGTDDRVLDIQWARGAVNAFKEQGQDATLHEYAGVGHAFTEEMRRDVWAEIARVVQPLP